MKLVPALLVAFVVSLIASLIIGPVLGLVAAVIVFFVVKGSRAGAKSYPAGFEPAFEHDNIAIDQKNDKLWLRDTGGHATVVGRSDILRWNSAFTSRGIVHFDNRIEIHVRDLNKPKYDVAFRRHSDTWKWNARRNHEEMEEWTSRLTTWVNNSSAGTAGA